MENVKRQIIIAILCILQIHLVFSSNQDELTFLKSEILELRREQRKQADFNNDLHKENLAIKDELQFLRRQMLVMQSANGLEDANAAPDLVTKTSSSNPIGTYMVSDAVCSGEEVTLACTDGKTIFVEKAEYGQYSMACEENSCCTPNPYDCVELLQEVDPVEWAVIKTLCDNQTQCTYLFRSSIFLQDCSPGNDVDYLAVYFTCKPGDLNEPVGFTAYSPYGEYTCMENEVVPFQLSLSNFGGYYDETSGIFHCPYIGIYMFFVNIQCYDDVNANVELMIDTSTKGRAIAENSGNLSNTASAFTITQCTAGQKAWVRCNYDDHVIRFGNRVTTFSGYLLHYL